MNRGIFVNENPVTSAGQEMEWTNAVANQFAAGSLAVDDGNGMTWRYMLVIASLPAIALWIGIRLMPESSRWYVANLRIPEAIGSLKRVRNEAKDGPIADEVDEMLEIQRKEANQKKLVDIRRIYLIRLLSTY